MDGQSVAAVDGAGVRKKVLYGWREPLVLWQCTLGRSGTGKSPDLAAGRRLVEAIENQPRNSLARIYSAVRASRPSRCLAACSDAST